MQDTPNLVKGLEEVRCLLLYQSTQTLSSAVSRLKVSPTAIGLCLFKAIRLPPAKNLDTDEGALPDAKRNIPQR